MTGSPHACTGSPPNRPRPGARLHAVGDQGVPFLRIAETIGHHVEVPARTISPAEAEAHFGFPSALVALDNPSSSGSTQELLVQQPTHPDLLADIDEGHYCEA